METHPQPGAATATMSVSVRRPTLLHEVFEAQAASTPDALAVEFIEAGRALTYRQLDERARLLAEHLHRLGAERNGLVAIYLPRGIEQYVAMLGILKAGAAYLPIDAEFPEERIRYTLEDAGVGHVITCDALAAALPAGPWTAVSVDDVRWGDAHRRGVDRVAALPRPDATDLCYVIYTSGTTGRPKGVCISHLNAVTYVRAIEAALGVRGDDRVLQGFSTAFDSSVEEIWMAFSAGATLVVGSLSTMRAVDELPAKLRDLRISVLSTVPTLLAVTEPEELPALRLLISGGEVARDDVLGKWLALGRKVLNGYGPTESTVMATFDWCAPGAPVTIGHPMPGYHVLILDPEGLERTDGQEGELCIGGDAVSLRGYLNRPALNAKKFFERDGKRFYRTGDIVLRNPDGKLVFRGRIDSQVKIRGYRVELEEIEAQLLRWVDCEGAIVHAHRSADGDAQLVAYLIDKEPPRVDLQALSRLLRQDLPAYMVPAHFAWLHPADIPQMTSGKVDRAGLPPLADSHLLAAGTAAATPEDDLSGVTELERKLLGHWRDTLGAPIGLDDSFFDYGGDSVMAAKLITRCRRDEDLAVLSVRDLYQCPTVRAMGQRLVARLRQHASPPRGAGHGAGGAGGGEARAAARSRVSRLQYAACGAMQGVVLMSLIAVQGLAMYALFHALVWLWERVEPGGSYALALLAGGIALALPAALAASTAFAGAALKRLIIGRLEPGDHALWGWGYFRWWLARVLLAPSATVGAALLGTPLAGALYRRLGARIGRGVHLGSPLEDPDLVIIGDGASLSEGVILRTHAIVDGVLKLRRVHIGELAFVGAQSIVGAGARLGAGAKLHHLSYLPAGAAAPARSEWRGSPAARLTGGENAMSRILRRHEDQAARDGAAHTGAPGVRVGLLQLACAWGYGALAFIPTAAQLGLMYYLEVAYGALSNLDLRVLLPAALGFSALRCFGQLAAIIAAKWLMTGRARAGIISLNSREFARRWLCGRLMRTMVSPGGTRGVTETVLMPHVCRWLGMRVGRGAEVSDALGFQPDLVSLGDESMLADRCFIGVPVVHRGRMSLERVAIGDRTFVANLAHVSIATPRVEDASLIGVLSAAPESMDADSTWLGSPPMKLPKRTRHCVPERYTFAPPRYMYAVRGFFNLWKMILPAALIEMTAWIALKLGFAAHARMSTAGFMLLLPCLLLALHVTRLLLPALAKWLLVWRYPAGQRLFWSPWMWRIEIVYEIELLVRAMYDRFLNGTPLLSMWFRAMGARVGKRVCIYDGSLMEADLAQLGDDVSIEGSLQTHLLEDRVMNLGRVVVKDGCTIGREACVQYHSEMGARSSLDDLSLIMKYETFLPRRTYGGLPAEALSEQLGEGATPPDRDARAA